MSQDPRSIVGYGPGQIPPTGCMPPPVNPFERQYVPTGDEIMRARAAGVCLPASPSVAGPLAENLASVKGQLSCVHERLSLLENKLSFVLQPTGPSEKNILAKPHVSAGVVNAIEDIKAEINALESRMLNIIDRLAV